MGRANGSYVSLSNVTVDQFGEIVNNSPATCTAAGPAPPHPPPSPPLPPPTPPLPPQPPFYFPAGCAGAQLQQNVNLTGIRLVGTYFSNPTSTGVFAGNSSALSPVCGSQLCERPNLGCDYGCFCFVNGSGVPSVVGFFYSDPCNLPAGRLANGTYISMVNVTTDGCASLLAPLRARKLTHPSVMASCAQPARPSVR